MKFAQIKAFRKSIGRYFHNYGGWRAVLNSPLFLAALLITSLSYSDWIEPKWVERSVSIVPSLLGFSLGTYAILFSLMSGRIKNALKYLKNERGISYLMEINSTFFHFIFVQILSILWSFLFSTSFVHDFFYAVTNIYNYSDYLLIIYRYAKLVGSFIGHLLLIYSLMLILGATLAVYRLASIVDPAEK